MSCSPHCGTDDTGAFSLLEACYHPDPSILFNDSIIRDFDFSETSCSVHGISYLNPGKKTLIVRPLERTDYNKGYLALLSQLTVVGEYSWEVFQAQFDGMKDSKGCYFILVVEDQGIDGTEGRVVANASLIIERKFIHCAALRGRIEEVVVDKEYRGMHLALLLMETLKMLSQALGCYKITLDCKEDIMPYYRKLGYVNEGQYLLSHRF